MPAKKVPIVIDVMPPDEGDPIVSKGVFRSDGVEGPKYGAKTLLIRREKAYEAGAPRGRHPDPEFLGPRIPFKVAAIFGNPSSDRYEEDFKRALEFIDERLYIQNVSLRPRIRYVIAFNLTSLGVELPEELSNFDYFPKNETPPSYYEDEEDYSRLWKLRDREYEERQ